MRALPVERTKDFANCGSSGLWTAMGSGIEFRVVNQTANCSGPRLIVFKNAVPDDQSWAPMPPGWVQAGNIKFSVMYGTLCPAVTRTRGVSSTVNTVSPAIEQAPPGSIPVPATFGGGFGGGFGGCFGSPGSFSSRAGGASSIASEDHEAAYEATYEHEPSSAAPSTHHSPQHSPQIVSSLDELIEAHAHHVRLTGRSTRLSLAPRARVLTLCPCLFADPSGGRRAASTVGAQDAARPAAQLRRGAAANLDPRARPLRT